MRFPDVNECDTLGHNCHENAECSDTDGSYTCSCVDGYTGNGTFCSSKRCAYNFCFMLPVQFECILIILFQILMNVPIPHITALNLPNAWIPKEAIRVRVILDTQETALCAPVRFC